ncbi:hypothetical protein CLV35_1288 [Motilibacter peucedani]|uniref:Uncharacterized protein n=1 Tax=Motilibacter peucedani TaxID=598650 RepID=A0A420XRU9_9ACTN|nr:hypothetical protein [Motilibacter peucedani]RKS77594.1 hypothetical protein CLV35_1288 [Motilibacter peucedani]
MPTQPNTDQLQRMTDYLRLAIDQVGGTPVRMAATSDLVIQEACIESFLTSARLLIEFLVKHGDRRDFNSSHFGVPRATGPEAERLGAVWDTASQHVVHFSLHRVPANLDELQVIGDLGRWMNSVAHDCLTLAEQFLEHLDAATMPQLAYSLLRARSELDRFSKLL